MMVRWYRLKTYQLVVISILITSILYYMSLQDDLHRVKNLDFTRSVEPVGRVNLSNVAPSASKYLDSLGLVPIDTNRRKTVIEYIERSLEEALKLDKGTGCEIPNLDPFAKEVTKFDKILPKVVCPGTDWVKCYQSECRVIKEILDRTTDVECTYNDIIYIDDAEYQFGEDFVVKGSNVYVLKRSDHVKVKCTGYHIDSILPSKWKGTIAGFRFSVYPKTPPQGRENTLNVLILGFDSTSRNGFIRRMPKSYKFLQDEFKAVILKGMNIVGDGTPATLFPILTGKTELELPDVRKKMGKNGSMDSMPFIFYKLKDDGYRTAYFEDMPWIGTFQYRFNGFKYQPADHYLRAFYLEESNREKKWDVDARKYCVGDTPQYRLMLNLTEQFLKLNGKRFCFTFIADITHDDFNMISTSDEDLVSFLQGFRQAGHMEDTLLMVMGDHGARYAYVRDTLQGKLEERLPLMAIILPEALKRDRPGVEDILRANSDVLTTPHDVYATVLDVLEMRQYWNSYKVTGADLTRGLTLLEPVPRNRSCSEAGIEPHWCACAAWRNLSDRDPLYRRTADALLAYINSLTEGVRQKCALRTLTSIPWVMRQRANSRMLSFVSAQDTDGYVGKFGASVRAPKENYQVKIIVGPGKGVYEASLIYLTAEDKFELNFRDISRTNAYNNEPSCISATHPHLNMYCYCN